MLQTLSSPRGMITAPHHLAAQAGLSVLREGGNAVEAMVAAAAAIAVVYPHMNSLGGDGFWIIAEPGKNPVGVEASGPAAQAATIDFYRSQGHAVIPSRGPLAANTVSGAISGWQAALDASLGWNHRLPLARLLADAIWYANHGVPVTRSQHAFTTKFLDELAPQPGFAQAFLDADGRPPRAETLRTYPKLGATLERLTKAGLDDWYRGDIGAALGAELERIGSPVRRADLDKHRARIVEPLTVKLRSGQVWNMTPPTQGLASLMILGIFDRLGVTEAEGFDHLHGLIEATKLAFRVRNRHLADPFTMSVNPADFLTDAALAERAKQVDRAKALPWPEPIQKGDTIWMGCCDAEGRMASYIQSVYWEFGSGVVLRDTGVVWQNRGSIFSLDPVSHLALAPGKRPFHTLNPAFARLADGRSLVYGTMGGDGQPQTQAAIYSRHAMFGQPLQQAVTAPRWLLGKTWGQESITLKLESRFDAKLVDRMKAAGHNMEMVEAFSDTMGHAGAVSMAPDGLRTGAADPRSDGVVAGF